MERQEVTYACCDLIRSLLLENLRHEVTGFEHKSLSGVGNSEARGGQEVLSRWT